MEIQLAFGSYKNFITEKHFENYLNFAFRTRGAIKFEKENTSQNLLFSYTNNKINYLNYGNDELQRKLSKSQIRALLYSQFRNICEDVAMCGFYLLCNKESENDELCIDQNVLTDIVQSIDNDQYKIFPILYFLFVDKENYPQLHILYQKVNWQAKLDI